MEQFSLQYRKFEISYSAQSSLRASSVPPVTAGFDVQQNKKL